MFFSCYNFYRKCANRKCSCSDTPDDVNFQAERFLNR